LQSIFENNYPLASFEIIVIDDYSTDDTPNIVASFKNKYDNIRLFKMAELLNGQQLNSYKKKAIEIAIAHTQAEWIITTDADCIVGKHWLETYNEFISCNEIVFIAAPVSFIDTGSFIGKFQCLDFLSLQGITAASVSAGMHSMCNGANLCYKKSAFEQVGGFSGVDILASGDDMFLMYKILKQFPHQVKYLFSRNAIVQTLPMPDWKQFLNQRIRWASKASGYEDKKIIAVLVLVYLFNLSFPVLFVAGFLNFFAWKYLLLFFVIKYVVELAFMYPVAKFYHRQNLLKWFVVMQPFHIVYTLFAGALGKTGTYKWKGRSVK
jgi:cellulose synthase/poly-beta-1,6-N-acetylglucosamine synthase-like glycosyltransferase